MNNRTAMLRSAAMGAVLAAMAAGAAQAQTASESELLRELQALRAEVRALQGRLDAQEQAQVQVRTQAQTAQSAASAAQESAKAVEAQVAALPAPPTARIAFDGAPRFTDGGNSLKIRGRLLLDAVWQDIDRPGTANDVGVSQIRGRQAFLGVEGNVGPNWFYKLEGGAVNGGAWAWDDAYLEYRRGQNALIVGNQKGVGLENLTSTRFTSFLDRGPMDNLIDATYHLGVHYWRVGKAYSFNAGVTGHTLNNPDVTTAAGSDGGLHERLTASARATVAPVNTAATTVHLGAWGRYRKRGDDGAFTYAVGYNSPLRVQTPLTTGAAGDNDFALGLEAAFVHKSLSVQGEWANMSVKPGVAAVGDGFNAHSGYAFVSFFPTGEKRAYAVRGEFGRTRVLKPLGQGGLGALELLGRVDYADLSDAKSPLGAQLLNAGVYKSVTLGASWYPVNYVKFMANYTHGSFDNVGLANDGDVDVFQMRAQIDW